MIAGLRLVMIGVRPTDSRDYRGTLRTRLRCYRSTGKQAATARSPGSNASSRRDGWSRRTKLLFLVELFSNRFTLAFRRLDQQHRPVAKLTFSTPTKPLQKTFVCCSRLAFVLDCQGVPAIL